MVHTPFFTKCLLLPHKSFWFSGKMCIQEQVILTILTSDQAIMENSPKMPMSMDLNRPLPLMWWCLTSLQGCFPDRGSELVNSCQLPGPHLGLCTVLVYSLLMCSQCKQCSRPGSYLSFLFLQMKQILGVGALHETGFHGMLAVLPMRWVVRPFLKKIDAINLI